MGIQAAIDRLSTMPPLDQDEQFYWNAWDGLASERPVAMAGIAPIPLTSILAYAAWADLTPSETDHLVQVIRTMDSRLIVTVNEKRAKNREAASRNQG